MPVQVIRTGPPRVSFRDEQDPLTGGIMNAATTLWNLPMEKAQLEMQQARYSQPWLWREQMNQERIDAANQRHGQDVGVRNRGMDIREGQGGERIEQGGQRVDIAQQKEDRLGNMPPKATKTGEMTDEQLSNHALALAKAAAGPTALVKPEDVQAIKERLDKHGNLQPPKQQPYSGPRIAVSDTEDAINDPTTGARIRVPHLWRNTDPVPTPGSAPMAQSGQLWTAGQAPLEDKSLAPPPAAGPLVSKVTGKPIAPETVRAAQAMAQDSAHPQHDAAAAWLAANGL